MFFRRNRFSRELNEEMAAHLAEREASYVRDGVAPSEARRRARLDFGNPAVIHEQSRDVWLVRWLDNLASDTRIALRMLRAAPGFTFAAVATLALGIGANAAIFTMVDGLLVRPLPYADADRLVRIRPGFPAGALLILREHGRHYSAVGGYSPGTEVTWTGGAEPLRLEAAVVSGDVLPLLGAHAERGRTIEPGDEKKGAERVTVVSHGFWRQHLGGADVLGRAITINDEPLRIVGIMPASFRFPDAGTDLWIPATIDPANAIGLWATSGMQFVARLADGVSPEAAQADVPRLAALVRDGFPWPMPTEFGLTTTIEPLQRSTVSGVRDALLLLAGAVALVLIIACANVATLLLARSESRARELAVRGALGAGRGRLAAQLLLESAIIAGLGAAAGLALLAAALPILNAAVPAAVPRIRDFAIEPRVLAFAAGATLVTTLLIGLMPAIGAARPDLTSALRSGDARAGRRGRAFGALVAAEVALALMLVTGAGLLLHSLANLTAVDPGFTAEGLAAARVHPIEGRYATTQARVELYRTLVERAGAIPGVDRAAAVSALPLDDPRWLALSIEEHPVPEGAPAWMADQRFVTDDYFAVMGIPLREGRIFDSRDTTTSQGAIVINETMARRYWPGASPVGRRIRPVWQTEWRTVVGVVADVRNRGLAEPVMDEIYIPYAQNPAGSMVLVARTSLPEGDVAQAMRAVVAAVDPQAPVGDIGPVSALIADTVADRVFVLRMLSLFAVVALALGAIGIYGVTAYGVARRAPEIGLRLALGGSRRAVVTELVRQMGPPIAAGLGLGVAGALAGGPLLRGMLYQSSPAEPVILAGVLGVLSLTALAAALLPAVRAARVEPATALRRN